MPSLLTGNGVPAIDSDGIVVWTVALHAAPDETWPRLNRLLNADERERAARFAFERDRRQYQAAHALKRLMLTATTAGLVPPEAWMFDIGKQGKPRVAGGMGPFFNLTHCDGFVACAVNRRIELGIDAERLDRHAPLELAGNYFAPAEQSWLRSLPTVAQPSGFFSLWTLKEAYIKATGLGLGQPLEDFAFHFNPLRVTFSDPTLGDPTTWSFDQRTIGRHILALAWRATEAETAIEVTTVGLGL